VLKLGYNLNLITGWVSAMWKMIFLGLLIWLIIYIMKRAIRPAAKHADHTNEAESKKANQEPGENMVKCATCHVHLPRSEAFLVNGNFYCSQAHIENK
jgi:flagellar biosynthesis/type III secretory pathway M-ring protein FliF/YscJ